MGVRYGASDQPLDDHVDEGACDLTLESGLRAYAVDLEIWGSKAGLYSARLGFVGRNDRFGYWALVVL